VRASGRTAEIPSSLLEPDVDPASAARAEEILRPLPSGALRVAVCVGGRADALHKRYPAASWSALLGNLLKADSRLQLLFTGTREEAADVRAVADGLPRALDLSGRLSQLDLVEVLRRCDLVLSNDTGTIHLAAAVGKWCVGFYGPTDPAVYGPYTGRRLVLRDPRNVTQVTNLREKLNEGRPVYWPAPEEAFERIRPLLTVRA
jgi:ADP-heptose:LPS heptosyltransferase